VGVSVPETAEERTLEAFVKMEVACRLALESLSQLPSEKAALLRSHIESLCDLTERELQRLQPGFARKARD
jgi:hypothetical protein